MAQVTNRATLANALTTALDTIFTNRGKTLKKIYPGFMRTQDIDKGQYIDYDQAYFGKLVKKGEQEQVTYDQLEWGNVFTATADSYALGFRISREALDDLKGGGYGVDTAKVASMGTITARFQDAALATQEDLSAQAILLANSTTVTAKWIGAGRDGNALAASHTPLKNGIAAFNNAQTAAALNYYQLQAGITLLETIQGDEGFYSQLPSTINLVVGPYNRHRAYELVKSQQKPDTNENNPNALNDFNIKVIVDPYLGSTFKGWALMDPNRHKVYFFNRTDPTLENETDFEVKGVKYSVFMRCKVSFSSPYGFVFNAGA